MNPVSEDIKTLLVEAGAGTFALSTGNEWGIYISEEPDSPTNTITIYDTPSIVARVQDPDSHHFMQSSFQIRVRHPKYLEGHKKIIECRDILDRITTRPGHDAKRMILMDGVRYDNILMDQDPLPLTKDDKGRQIFTLDGVAYRQETGRKGGHDA